MPKTPKTIIEEESLRLIKYITEFEDDDENLQICERFALSNLFYHKYLDPDERKINKAIQGVKEKFVIHAQFEKAEFFQDLVNKFKKSPAFEGPLEQHDICFRLLSLMLNLAENPVNVDYEPSPIALDEPEEEKVDWLAILKEGEQSPSPLGSESELSDWSEDEDGSEVVEKTSQLLQSTTKVPETHIAAVKNTREVFEDDPNIWIQANIQFPYWHEEQRFSPSSANFAGHVETELEKRGKLDAHTEKITEYQLLREIVWMLRTPTDSPVFEFRNGKFKVSDLVTIPSLTDLALSALLEEVLPTFGHVFALKEFINQIEHPGPGVIVAHTVEAYTSSLNAILHQFSDHLLLVERDIVKQEKTLTTLTLLENIRPWTEKIKFIRNIHHLATQDYFESEDNCYRSMRILSVVYNALISSIHKSIIDSLMDMFLGCVRPFLRILDTWLSQGLLLDYRQEFIFYHNPDATEENLWDNLFRQRDYSDQLSVAGIRPLALFHGLANKILLSGKSNAILTKMDRISVVGGCASPAGDAAAAATNHTVVVSTTPTVGEEFVASIKTRIPKFFSREPAQKAEMVQNRDEKLPGESGVVRRIENPQDDVLGKQTCQQIVASVEDKFLATAFTNIFNKMEETLVDNTPKIEEKLLGVSLDPLIPLESIMTDSLASGIHRHFNTSCSSLVRLFTKDLNVEAELGRARLVFFQEAGDLMQDFNHQIFRIIHRRDSDLLDSSSLTLLLQDCLSQRFVGWVDKFSCTFTAPEDEAMFRAPSIAGLSINMHVEWPLNIILSPKNLKMYNKIYLFLVGVKHSLWCLQSVSLKQVSRMDQQLEKEDSLNQELSDSSLTAGEKRHRVQLLRSWLLYFVTLIHGYFMSRVVHSTHLQLSEGISTATDLDMLIDVHHTYLQQIHDRCFLHSGVKMLKEAISMILGICLDLHAGITANNIHTHSINEWEAKYARCHNFLATTLSSLVRKSKLPHLEGLAAALLHSCPTQQ